MKNYVTVITANMGNCECGDCYCIIFSNGEIQYSGQEKWQNSERKKFEDVEPRRPYNSQLTAKQYKEAREALAKLGS